MKRRIGAKPGDFPVVPYTHEFERNGEWQCRELEFQFSVEPIVPGKYFGPPENCFPDEGGDVELQDIQDQGNCPIVVEHRFDAEKKENLCIIRWPNGEAPDCIIDEKAMKELEDLASENVEEYEPEPREPYDC